MRNLGSEVKASYVAIQPQVVSGEATAINGPAVNRRGYQGAVLVCQIGNTAGTPTRFGITFKAQARSGETDWVDISGATKTWSGESVATQNQQDEINIDLKGIARDIRAVVTPTFTAGTTPTLETAAAWVLGEAAVEPA
jgi:hypothetical protein